MTELEIEQLELKYLNTIESLIKGNLNNILNNLDSMNQIVEYWKDISTDEGFDTGSERIIYSVFIILQIIVYKTCCVAVFYQYHSFFIINIF